MILWRRLAIFKPFSPNTPSLHENSLRAGKCFANMDGLASDAHNHLIIRQGDGEEDGEG